MKIKIHPLFFVLALYFVIIGRGILLGGYLLSVLMHEVAHARMAKLRGFALGEVTIMPYGGVISGGVSYNKTDQILIAIAGPLTNYAAAIALAALWWLLPASYNWTAEICAANVALGTINLLPAYPLDGSRVVWALSRNKLRATKWLRVAGICVGVTLLALCVVSAFFVFNPTIGIFGVFLAYGALEGEKQNTYLHMSETSPIFKNYRYGLRFCRVYIDRDAPLLRLVGRLNAQERYEFILVDADGRESARLDESDLGELCKVCELNEPVGRAFDKYLANARKSAANT